MALGRAPNWEVGREVDAMGDCYFDAFLAQLQDPRIRMTIDPVLLRGITTPQGFKHYILIKMYPVNS